MSKNRILLLLLLLPLAVLSQGTIGDFTGDESVLYAQTKQMNQFFRRFNGEEDVNGKRFYPGDAGYRDSKMRRKYLNILFDNAGAGVDQDTRDAMILELTGKTQPYYLDFHGGSWFAEINSVFLYKKERVNILLYLKLEKEGLGSKWVISNIWFDRYDRYFTHVSDTSLNGLFLHPMSHELDFMNIHKAFDDPEKFDHYLEKNYQPDHLALFVADLKNGNLKFSSVNQVKFHFFQVPNWYFEVSWFNRNTMNSGWLISNVVRVNAREKQELIRHYTHE